MKTVTAYEAHDGKIFASAFDCHHYEKTSIKSMFIEHVNINCSTTYIDDWNTNVIEPSDVADYIITHWDYLKSLMDTMQRD